MNPIIAPGTLVQDVYQFALIIGGLLAFGAIVFGAIKYTLAAGNPTGQHEGKEWITQALLGLLLLVGAALILGTINPRLRVLELPSDLFVKLQGTSGVDQPLGAGASNLSESDVKGQLEKANISIKGSPRLAGLHQIVIDELVRLKQACNCEVVVNSATGGNHNPGQCSHSNGYKVDLDNTGSLNTHMLNRQYFVPAGTRSDGAPLFRSVRGQGPGLYAQESTHWDMAISC